MDIFRMFGVLVAALVVPLIILIIYKAVPGYRRTNPKTWYITSIIIASLLIIISLTPFPEKITALVISFVILFMAMRKDAKRFKNNSSQKSDEEPSENA